MWVRCAVSKTKTKSHRRSTMVQQTHAHRQRIASPRSGGFTAQSIRMTERPMGWPLVALSCVRSSSLKAPPSCLLRSLACRRASFTAALRAFFSSADSCFRRGAPRFSVLASITMHYSPSSPRQSKAERRASGLGHRRRLLRLGGQHAERHAGLAGELDALTGVGDEGGVVLRVAVGAHDRLAVPVGPLCGRA